MDEWFFPPVCSGTGASPRARCMQCPIFSSKSMFFVNLSIPVFVPTAISPILWAPGSVLMISLRNSSPFSALARVTLPFLNVSVMLSTSLPIV